MLELFEPYPGIFFSLLDAFVSGGAGKGFLLLLFLLLFLLHGWLALLFFLPFLCMIMDGMGGMGWDGMGGFPDWQLISWTLRLDESPLLGGLNIYTYAYIYMMFQSAYVYVAVLLIDVHDLAGGLPRTIERRKMKRAVFQHVHGDATIPFTCLNRSTEFHISQPLTNSQCYSYSMPSPGAQTHKLPPGLPPGTSKNINPPSPASPLTTVPRMEP